MRRPDREVPASAGSRAVMGAAAAVDETKEGMGVDVVVLVDRAAASDEEAAIDEAVEVADAMGAWVGARDLGFANTTAEDKSSVGAWSPCLPPLSSSSSS